MILPDTVTSKVVVSIPSPAWLSMAFGVAGLAGERRSDVTTTKLLIKGYFMMMPKSAVIVRARYNTANLNLNNYK